MEIWDGYDINEKKLEYDLIRDNPLKENEFHLVVQIIVSHIDGSILLMRRDLQKKDWPGYWESTAGGSVLKDETALQGARRELFEETGIKSDSFALENHFADPKRHSIYYVYSTIVDIDKDSIVLQEKETIDYQWITKDEYREFYNSDKIIPSQAEMLYTWYIKNVKE